MSLLFLLISALLAVRDGQGRTVSYHSQRHQHDLRADTAASGQLQWGFIPSNTDSLYGKLDIGRGQTKAIHSRAELLVAYPHLFPSCQALLHMLERTNEGRNALKAVLGPLQHLQYLQRTVRQYEIDIEMLDRLPADRLWAPYMAVGLERQRQQQQGTGANGEGTEQERRVTGRREKEAPGDGAQPVPATATAAPSADSAAAASGGAAAGAAGVAAAEDAALAAGGVRGSGVLTARPAAAALEAAPRGQRGDEEGVKPVAAAEIAAAVAAAQAADAAAAAAVTGSAADAAAVTAAAHAEGTTQEAARDTAGARRARELAESSDSLAGGSPLASSRLSFVEKVLHASTDLDQLKAELEARRVEADKERQGLQPVVDEGLQQLRNLLRNASATAATRTPGGGVPMRTTANNLTADPNDLELYDLLLAPCVLARLDPRSYVSYPPRPLVSLVLPYCGRRMPYVLAEVVEPLLACAAGGAGAGGEGEDGDDATVGPLALELLVGFDEPDEAAAWAAVAAESGGRVVPVFRPGGTRGGVPGDKGGSGASPGPSLPLSPNAVRRLVSMAQGEVVVLLRDGDLLPYDYCSWLQHALRAFDAWPRMGALGGGPFVLDWHPASLNRGTFFWDQTTSMPMQFVTALLGTSGSQQPAGGAGSGVGDGGGSEGRRGRGRSGPMAIRRAAWRQLGGVEGGLGSGALCGSCAGVDLSTRLWLAGWMVASLHAVGGSAAPANWRPDHWEQEGSAGRTAAGEALLAGSRRNALLLTDPTATPDGGNSGDTAASAVGTRTSSATGGSAGASGQAAAATDVAAGPAAAAAAAVAIGEEVEVDAPWCERGDPQLQRRLETLCARVLQMRYGRSPYWEDRAGDGPGAPRTAGGGGGGGGGTAGRGSAAWFLGSELHVRITEHVRLLNLMRLRRLPWPRGECPFGAAGCDSPAGRVAS